MRCLNHYFNLSDEDVLLKLLEEKLISIIINVCICFSTMRHMSSFMSIGKHYLFMLLIHDTDNQG